MAISIDASPPPSNHIATLKKVGYSFNSAVGDIVDNSIAARCKNIEFIFLPLSDGPRLIIADDGDGMNSSELQKSMVIGCKNPNDEREEGDLGRFGSGLKTASFSQADILTVVSKTTNSEISAARWDTLHVQSINQWSLQILDKADFTNLDYVHLLEAKSSGTLVCWDGLNFIEVGDYSRPVSDQIAKLCVELEKYLSRYFHRFMAGKDSINFSINGRSIAPLDPFMRHISGYEEGPSTSLRSKKGQIEIASHILPRFNQMTKEQIEEYGGNYNITKKQGLYIYRDKRLIIEGGWLGLAPSKEHTNLARIQIDIPAKMDNEWSTDLKKSTLKLPPKIRTTLKKIIGSPIRRSTGVHVYAGKKEKENPYWNIREDEVEQKISYEVNVDHSEIRKIFDALSHSLKSNLIRFLASASKNVPLNHIYTTMSKSPKSIDQEIDFYEENEEILND
jgi:hypothetical protein